MDEDNNIRALDKLLAMLKIAGWECIADEADSYLVVIDANGDPHECWDGGIPNDVNVCIPLSVENAVDYFADPNQIYLKDENVKLREQLEYDRQTSRSRLERIDQLKTENAKLRELVNSYANSFEKDAAMNNGCGPYYSGEDWLALANDMRIELAECCGELGVEVSE